MAGRIGQRQGGKRGPVAHDTDARERISAGTRAALDAARAAGVALGGDRGAEARARGHAIKRAAADEFAARMLPIIQEIRRSGATNNVRIAEKLNEMGMSAPRGGKWSHSSVWKILNR